MWRGGRSPDGRAGSGIVSGVRQLLVAAARTPVAIGAFGLLDRALGGANGVFALLTYHRVDEPQARPWLYPSLISATPADFESQMRLLRARHRPVSMPDLLAAYESGRPLPPRAVHVTFDDAYSDFATNAWPVLRELDIPVTLFVPTGYPDNPGRAFWWDRLWLAALATSGGSESAARAEVGRLAGLLKALPHDAALAAVDAYCSAQPEREHPPAVLGWSELRRLAGEGVFVACHSRTHPLLTRVTQDRLETELHGTREDLEREIPGAPGSRVLAYPGGAYDPAVAAAAARAGFRLAFGTRRGTNRAGQTPPHELRRINVGQRTDERLIHAQLLLAGVQRRWTPR